jgi:GTP-binding protein
MKRDKSFVDEVKIFVEGGKGGNGCVSFRREKFVPKGGPDGGDGGNGGDVILRASKDLNTLLHFKYRYLFKAKNGKHGEGSKRKGKDGESLVLEVPVGTEVYDEEGNLLVDLSSQGETFVAARGGRGGRGNSRFATPTNQAPRLAEKGEPGESRWLKLHLKLLADVGIVGFPNAGKSTFLSRISHAHPRISNYPFTTLAPQLGVVEKSGSTFVAAEIPGLIEGAHEGRGLGIEFLKHVERCRVLLHLIDLSGVEKKPIEAFETIQSELKAYGKEVFLKPVVVAGNKIDLKEARDNIERVSKYFFQKKIPFFPISAVTGEGTPELINYLFEKLKEVPRPERKKVRKVVVKASPIKVEKISKGVYRVEGGDLEKIVEKVDLSTPEGRVYIQKRLKRTGVEKELLKAGVEKGDLIRIGKEEFVFYPSS